MVMLVEWMQQYCNGVLVLACVVCYSNGFVSDWGFVCVAEEMNLEFKKSMLQMMAVNGRLETEIVQVVQVDTAFGRQCCCCFCHSDAVSCKLKGLATTGEAREESW